MATGQRRHISAVAVAINDMDRKLSPAPNHLNSTVKVEDILSRRGEKVFSTTKDSTVFNAIKVRALPVLVRPRAQRGNNFCDVL